MLILTNFNFVSRQQVLFLILQPSNITAMSTAIYIGTVVAGGGIQVVYLFEYRRDIRIFFKSLEQFINVSKCKCIYLL